MTTVQPKTRVAPSVVPYVTSAAANEEPVMALAPAAPLDAALGQQLLREQGLAGLRATIAALPAEVDDGDGWSLFWSGYAAQFDDLGRARADWLRAEVRFAQAADAVGLELVASGLLQATGLDHQSFEDFEARAQRVAAIDLPPQPIDALDLFRVAGRLMLAGERRETDDAPLLPWVERAFSALNGQLDGEVRLRAAITALPVLGLALDRARVTDFFQAGAMLAHSVKVSAYGRVLWHLSVVEAQFFEASWAQRLHAELDSAEHACEAHKFRTLHARTRLLRAALVLGDGRLDEGKRQLDAAHGLIDPAHARDYWWFHYLQSRRALLAGEAQDALAQLRIARQKQADAQIPTARTVPMMMQEGFVLTALARHEEAARMFQQAGEASRGAHGTPSWCHHHLTQGLQRLHDGVLDEARTELIAGFTQARTINLTHFFPVLPNLAAQVCGAALDLDADVEFARHTIAARALACPDPGIAHWPWAVRIRTLGGFAIDLGGAQMKAPSKAPKRLIDLLRLLAAWGGRQVDARRVTATLWPEAGGDEGRDALKAMLHRARTLLGTDALLERDGQIAFNEQLVWLDTWGFEHVTARVEILVGAGAAQADAGRSTAVDGESGEIARRTMQLLALYRGHFLGEMEVPGWALPLRDRLRARFVRSVDALGRRLERLGHLNVAIALYRAALEQDNLADELYQRLIECHLARGEHAQALNVYRRCRELLSIVLGLKPSARTEALVAPLLNR